MDLDVLSTPGHLISLAARGFARLSEARLKPLGFGVGHLPVLVALQEGRVSTQRDLARFARVEQPPMAQMLARMERDGLIWRARDPADRRSSRINLTEARGSAPAGRDCRLAPGQSRGAARLHRRRGRAARRPAHPADRQPRPGRGRRSVARRGLTDRPRARTCPQTKALAIFFDNFFPRIEISRMIDFESRN